MSVWFPLSQAGDDEPRHEVDTATWATGSETVLVVEDDDMVRRFVERSLVEAGYRVFAARSADEAMDIFRTRDDEIHLVLTDVVMPGASGSDLAERLALVAPGLPLLFMSGYVDDRFLHRELERAPEQILRKPFTVSELRASVGRALGRHSAGAPRS
jgi:DNA-binding response OmpR family regulator